MLRKNAGNLKKLLVVLSVILSLTCVCFTQNVNADTSEAWQYGFSAGDYVMATWAYAFLSEVFDDDSLGNTALGFLVNAISATEDALYSAWYEYVATGDMVAYNAALGFYYAYEYLQICYAYAYDWAVSLNYDSAVVAGIYGYYGGFYLTYGLSEAARGID